MLFFSLLSESIFLAGREITYHNLNNAQYGRVVRDVILLLHYRLEVYGLSEGVWTLKAKVSGSFVYLDYSFVT